MTDPSFIGPFTFQLSAAQHNQLDVRIDGNLAVVNEADLYAVYGEAGQSLSVSVYFGITGSPVSPAVGISSSGRLRLIGPSGTVLLVPANIQVYAYSSGTGGRYGHYHISAQIDNFILPSTGNYFVEIIGGAGNYWLGISDPVPDPQPLSIVNNTVGSFGVQGDAQQFEFQATAGTAYGWTYRGRPIRNSGIYNSSSELVSSGPGSSDTTIAFTPQTSGAYQIRFEDEKTPSIVGLSFIGPFNFTLTPAEVEPPSSHVNPLPKLATSLDVQVTVTANDPVGINNVAPSGVATIDIYVAIGKNEFAYWTTVPASNPTATFHAQSNQTIWFASAAIDNAGNREVFDFIPDAHTFVGDFDAPVTQANAVSSDDSTGLITIDFSGQDVGGSGLKTFSIYVKIDGGGAELVATVPAGVPDLNGDVFGSANYQGITDGQEHSYTFFTTGTDSRGNVEAAPLGSNDDQTIVRTFNQTVDPEVTSIDVQNGANQRSYVRYVDITFNTDDPAVLSQLILQNRIRLERFGIDTSIPIPGTGAIVDLSSVSLFAMGNRIRLDFGADGIGGNRNSNAGDGFYQLTFDLDGDGFFSDARMGFYRLFGDANGDGNVDTADVTSLMSEYGRRGINLEGDINGDGVVNILDRVYTTRRPALARL